MIPLLEARLTGYGWSAAELLVRDAPGGLAEPGSTSANGYCRLLRCRDGWAALNLARPEDRELVPALTRLDGDTWAAVAQLARELPVEEFRARGGELHLPVAIVGEAAPQQLAPPDGTAVPRKVVDLSALWAGPLCAGFAARGRARGVGIEGGGRYDPTPQVSPMLDAQINAGKQRLPLDLRTAEGRAALLGELADADVLVTSAREAALARLGLKPAELPHLTWVAITAHGFTGPNAVRVGFGDDCAAAGGLLRWDAGEPRFRGDALADPLTGLEAALSVLAGGQGLIDMAMARVAAAYAAGLG